MYYHLPTFPALTALEGWEIFRCIALVHVFVNDCISIFCSLGPRLTSAAFVVQLKLAHHDRLVLYTCHRNWNTENPFWNNTPRTTDFLSTTSVMLHYWKKKSIYKTPINSLFMWWCSFKNTARSIWIFSSVLIWYCLKAPLGHTDTEYNAMLFNNVEMCYLTFRQPDGKFKDKYWEH